MRVLRAFSRAEKEKLVEAAKKSFVRLGASLAGAGVLIALAINLISVQFTSKIVKRVVSNLSVSGRCGGDTRLCSMASGCRSIRQSGYIVVSPHRALFSLNSSSDPQGRTAATPCCWAEISAPQHPPIPAPPRFMRIAGFPQPVSTDAVIYVHGGPRNQSEKELVDCINNGIASGAVPSPLCFLLSASPSCGRWSERWRITIAFKTQADALVAAPWFSSRSVKVSGDDLRLQVTSLAYIRDHCGLLGWISADIGTR